MSYFVRSWVSSLHSTWSNFCTVTDRVARISYRRSIFSDKNYPNENLPTNSHDFYIFYFNFAYAELGPNPSNSNKDEASMFARFPVTRDKMWLRTRTNIASNPPITIHRHTAVKPTDLAELFSSIWTLLGAGFARAPLPPPFFPLPFSLFFFPDALDFILDESRKSILPALYSNPVVNDPEKKKISTISSRSILPYRSLQSIVTRVARKKIVIGRFNQLETAQGQRW